MIKRQRWYYFFLPFGEAIMQVWLLCFKILGKKKSNPGEDAPMIIIRITGTLHSSSSLMLVFNQFTFRKLSSVNLSVRIPFLCWALSVPMLYDVRLYCNFLHIYFVPPDCQGLKTQIMAYGFLYLTPSTWLNSTFAEHFIISVA